VFQHRDVDVHIDDGVLTIKAEKSEESKKKDSYISSSFQYYYTCALTGDNGTKLMLKWKMV